MRKYLLIDANIAAAYYLPRSAKNRTTESRVKQILDFCRSKKDEWFVYIPNFCIAETVSVFIKHSYGKWNKHVKRNGGTIDTRLYKKIIYNFQSDIHNGKFLYHLELNRYHVLGINFVAPIDHYFQMKRNIKNVSPAGTFDHLIISMGINLVNIHGVNNVTILTTDKRLSMVVDKCRSNLSKKTLARLKIGIAEDLCSKKFESEIFPKCLDISSCRKKDIESVFEPLKLISLQKNHLLASDKGGI